MARKYHTLVVRDTDDGNWYPQFGDYSRQVVVEERDNWIYTEHATRKTTKIITTSAHQHDINATIIKLNAKE